MKSREVTDGNIKEQNFSNATPGTDAMMSAILRSLVFTQMFQTMVTM